MEIFITVEFIKENCTPKSYFDILKILQILNGSKAENHIVLVAYLFLKNVSNVTGQKV